MNVGAAALRTLPPEPAHTWGLKLLKASPLPKYKHTAAFESKIGQVIAANPVGLAAGFDKNCAVPHKAQHLGFGFVEVGSVTPFPQAGNPKPRLFRLTEDQAVINRMGFNGVGADVFHRNLERLRPKVKVPLGVNLAATRGGDDPITDFLNLASRFHGMADYLTIDVSCPNTLDGKALQDPENLKGLLDKMKEQSAKLKIATPIFYKLGPDLQDNDIDVLVKIIQGYELDGLIITNTSTQRPDSLKSKYAGEIGGLSGAPLKPFAQATLQKFSSRLDGALPLIAVGGIATADDVLARLKAGASAVQLYTAMVFQGPGVVKKILKDLAAKMHQQHVTHISELV